ncbi:MAG TPA: DNA methyltransferase [Tepidisphaeraceae bacterium]|jgi:hypothetical protein
MGKTQHQNSFSFHGVRNSELFSNHWLEHRLVLEPEWQSARADANLVLDQLVKLWKVQRGRVDHYGTEQALEEAFIQPVLRALGWEINYQTFLRGRKPDYALFLAPEAYDAALLAGPREPEYWEHPALVADAKAWDRPLDRPAVVNNQREYPPEQIEWYLNNSLRDYGILTNGRLWRLIPREYESGQRRFQTYFECDLPRLLDNRMDQPDLLFDAWAGYEDFLRFYLFFSPAAFREPAPAVDTLAHRARAGSNEYRVGVGEGLKERVFDALRLCIEGFLTYEPNNLTPERDLEACRENSFVLLYRLLFVLFAEDRGLLPYRINRLYTENRSLGRFRDLIAQTLDRISANRDVDYKLSERAKWDDLIALFDIIDGGLGRYAVPAYNGGLFDSEQNQFLYEKVLPDRYLARVIDQLGRAPDPRHPERGLFRVDYRDLAIQHLGNLYEGLLELRPRYATEDMIVVWKKVKERDEERVVPASGDVTTGFQPTGERYKKGEVYLVTDKGERRASGSYYTPNPIVDYIVENTLGDLCEKINTDLIAEVKALEEKLDDALEEDRHTLESRLSTLRGEFDDRVLRLRVLDPSMGSGHFLIRACQYLAEQVATNPYTKDASVHSAGEEPTLTFWKRRIAENCLYGVDKNPLAVELAKLALWLETVAVNQPLTFLDFQLRHGDSLVGASVSALGGFPGSQLYSTLYEKRVAASRPTLLKTLAQIRQMPSDKIEQVKEKNRLYRKVFEPVRAPFRQAADLWCSAYFVDKNQMVSPQQYENVLKNLAKPQKLAALLADEPYKSALAVSGKNGIAALHWEIEFPEVFFDAESRRSDAGFDAIIGNPPYDVIADKETGRDESRFRGYLKEHAIYDPSFNGKNNLYKLFVCRVLDLLADGGMLGFITPMPILGDEQALGIRKEIFRVAAMRVIEAFPQKDRPKDRVFPEAKLSTTVFTLQRTSSDEARRAAFKVRAHPANKIVKDASWLTLSPAEIPEYDPQNMTIVACSHTDWQLALRVLRSKRMTRLSTYAASYQGEVNESNEKPKGMLSPVPTSSENGALPILRGAAVCLYALRDASQGATFYLHEAKFLNGKGDGTKAHHARQNRVGFQRSAPQNNFRRVISCLIPPGRYCFDTVSYVPEHESKLPLTFVMALLNSKLTEWFFRLGSTNSKVNEYQFDSLICPELSSVEQGGDDELVTAATEHLHAQNFDKAIEMMMPALDKPPFPRAVVAIICEATDRVVAIETARGAVTKKDRSALAKQSQPYQDFLDRVFFRLAGITDDEARALEKRLSKML